MLSSKRKKYIWKEIESTFNANYPMVSYRSAVTLCNFMKIKKGTKKEACLLRLS